MNVVAWRAIRPDRARSSAQPSLHRRRSRFGSSNQAIALRQSPAVLRPGPRGPSCAQRRPQRPIFVLLAQLDQPMKSTGACAQSQHLQFSEICLFDVRLFQSGSEGMISQSGDFCGVGSTCAEPNHCLDCELELAGDFAWGRSAGDGAGLTCRSDVGAHVCDVAPSRGGRNDERDAGSSGVCRNVSALWEIFTADGLRHAARRRRRSHVRRLISSAIHGEPWLSNCARGLAPAARRFASLRARWLSSCIGKFLVPPKFYEYTPQFIAHYIREHPAPGVRSATTLIAFVIRLLVIGVHPCINRIGLGRGALDHLCPVHT